MRIVIFGARGDVGRRVVAEALSRGHEVTAVVRRADQRDAIPDEVAVRIADVADIEAVADIMAGHDFAVSAVRPPEGQEDKLVPLTRSLLDAAAQAKVPILIVGGAASLTLPGRDGATVLTAPGFLPDSVRPIATASAAQFDLWAAASYADRTYLSPPALLAPGARTGRYRRGRDSLLFDAAGNSQISMEDFAVAVVDEAERPRHRGARFTVAN